MSASALDYLSSMSQAAAAAGGAGSAHGAAGPGGPAAAAAAAAAVGLGGHGGLFRVNTTQSLLGMQQQHAAGLLGLQGAAGLQVRPSLVTLACAWAGCRANPLCACRCSSCVRTGCTVRPSILSIRIIDVRQPCVVHLDWTPQGLLGGGGLRGGSPAGLSSGLSSSALQQAHHIAAQQAALQQQAAQQLALQQQLQSLAAGAGGGVGGPGSLLSQLTMSQASFFRKNWRR
jgi:hypothetical protein